MTDALNRAFVGDIEVRSSGDGRTIHGIVVPFGRVATVSDGGRPYQEAFQLGAFAKHLSERRRPVPLLGQHESRKNPLGVSSLLREDAAGLYGEFKVSKTSAGDEAIELARDGAMSFSVGFTPIKHVKREGVVVRTEAGMREASLVTFAAYEDALVGGVRHEDLSDGEAALVRQLLSQGYGPEYITNALAVVRTHNLWSTTPTAEPETLGTSTDAALVEEPAPATPVDVSKSFRSLRLKAREKGVL